MMKVFLISGKQGSGKSTLAQAIDRKLGDAHHTLRFAGIIYEIHDAAWGIMNSYGVTRDSAKDGRLLQLLGTEWGRSTLGEDIWVKCLMHKIYKLPHEDVVMVTVEDCRFENEFDAFIGMPGVVRIRLECSQAVRRHRASFWREDQTHPSEVGLDHYAAMGKFDFVFNTDEVSTDYILKEIGL